jgi:hypothetical protein
MVGVLLGAGESLLAAILYDAGRGAHRGFNSILEAALNDTSDHFHGEGIEFNKDDSGKSFEEAIVRAQEKRDALSKTVYSSKAIGWPGNSLA